MTSKALVIDGGQVLMRLKAERIETDSVVHVDWLRFTCQLRNAPVPSAEVLFPSPVKSTLEAPLSAYEEEMGMSSAQSRHVRLLRLLHALPDCDFSASAQAHALAAKVCSILGPDFVVEPELKKGHDFYRFRWSISRNDVECAWVGFLASGESPRQSAQALTIHANIQGNACTFARGDWRHRMAHLIEEMSAKVTRVDLALDFFSGISGGVERVRSDWHAGLMDVKGHRPVPNTVGPWVEGGRGRSFYFGSKGAGKQTNVYEKGVQLFGLKDATNWERVELRYGNKLRELSADMLRRPADYFGGASDWHAAILAEHGSECVPEPVRIRQVQAIQTVKAEVTRAVRWIADTASQSLAIAFQYLGEDEFLELVTNRQKPGRLRRFADQEIKAAFASLSPTIYKPRAKLAH